jgi:hypothetical protein
MTAAKAAPDDDLRMGSKEFDRIMGQALRVKPEAESKAKGRAKAKKATKKRSARK